MTQRTCGSVCLSSGIVLRPKFFNPCLLFSFLSLSICLGTGQPEINQKLRASTRLRHFPKSKLVIHTNRNSTSLSTGSSVDSCGSFFFTDKNPNNWLHWLVEQFFRQRIPKQCYQWLGKQNQQNLNKSNHPKLSATPRCSYPASPAHRPPGESIWVHLQRDPRKWMIMMFSLKHAWTLGPGIYPENQNTEQARRPANHAKQATSVDFKGTPLCGCKNCSKTTILNKGLNEEQLAWNFAILVLMVGPVKPATSPRIRRSTSISYKSGTLGPGI